ncbi:DUF4145 domain-containing protein [Bifidobacterium longum]|uniref:DUF4145 domain-containing protein n=1 Tax=Bifidobacterium longum subsp. longum TaxID=1679 RepID=A0A4R0TT69_BIFLL|nr:DUF4145 domain-containing protein [Bifidobacterium longum]RGQ72977.1 DUF4145 domain-containing protein [Bifidobacterium longum]TCE86620.1 hypothetical protein MCC10070_0818 [Bifidobacterium longum subsp. longum]TCE93035.1 hypothetical protein MCC10073_0852 [Bifidobacterium longum subsp. longum]
MVSRNCWHCHVCSNMSLPKLRAQYLYDDGSQIYDCTFPKPDETKEDEQDVFVVYRCDNCGYPNIGRYSAAWIKQPGDYGQVLEWIPASAIGKEYPDVPERVASAASECYKCFSIGAYRAAIIMARSVLEAIVTEKIQSPANERGYDKTLSAKLKDAAEEGVISKRLGDCADAIKDVGNGSTHNIFESIDRDYAEYVLSFMDSLIEETYQRDERLSKLAQLSGRLEQAKAEKLSGAPDRN